MSDECNECGCDLFIDTEGNFFCRLCEANGFLTTLRKRVEELEADRKQHRGALELAKDLLTLIRVTWKPPKELDDMIAFMQKKITEVLSAVDGEKESER